MRWRKYQNWLVLGLFAIAVHLLYAKTIGAGFVKDFTGLQEKLEHAEFWGFLHCYGFPALEQITHLCLFIIYKLFNAEGLPWYLVFTSLHIVNGYLSFRLGKQILEYFKVKEAFWIAITASLLFLLSPYQTETVTWKVCFNFLSSSLLILSTLYFLSQYLKTEGKQWIWATHVCFILALFTYELALILPFLSLILIVFWKSDSLNLKEAFLPILKKISLPQFSLLTGYFLLNKLWLGSWIGHYGASVHLNTDPVLIFGNSYKYFAKYLLFLRDLPHPDKMGVVQTFENPSIVWAITSILVLILILALKNYNKLPSKIKVSGLFFVLFLICLLPIANLYFGWILHVENDRYGYLACSFLFMMFMTLCTFLPKYLRWFFFLAYLGTSLFLTHRTTQFWQISTKIYYELLADFRWEKAEKIYMLAGPDNYKGIYLFKDYSKESRAVKDCLKYSGGKDIKGEITQVAQFNMATPVDGVLVSQDTSNQIQVKFNQWGNWWWRNGIGASNYQNDEYAFRRISNGYKLIFKEGIPKDAVFIYSNGGKWKSMNSGQSTVDSR